MLRMLTSLETIASLTADHSRRQALLEHMEWIAEVAGRTLESTQDRNRFECRLAQAFEVFNTGQLSSSHEQSITG